MEHHKNAWNTLDDSFGKDSGAKITATKELLKHRRNIMEEIECKLRNPNITHLLSDLG